MIDWCKFHFVRIITNEKLYSIEIAVI